MPATRASIVGAVVISLCSMRWATSALGEAPADTVPSEADYATLMQQGQALLDEGDCDAAISRFNAADALESTAESQRALGMAELKLGKDLERAKRHLQAALDHEESPLTGVARMEAESRLGEARIRTLTGKDLPSVKFATAPTDVPDAPSQQAAAKKTADKLAEELTSDLLSIKGGTFSLHEDNYFSLGLSGPHKYRAKFQVSVRFDILTLGKKRGYTASFAYTQKSFWNILDMGDARSKPFIENNYKPEGFFSFRPWKNNFGHELSLGVRHESNGLGFVVGGADQTRDSRSWNQAFLSLRISTPQLKLWRLRSVGTATLRGWVPWGVSAGEYASEDSAIEKARNKEMQKTLGYASGTVDLRFNSSWIYSGGALASESRGMLRVIVKGRSIEASAYIPIYSRGTLHADIFVQVFRGRAERLMLWDENVKSVYLGLGLL